MSEGVITSGVERGFKKFLEPVKNLWNDKDKVFTIVWMLILVIAICLIAFADFKVYKNPLMTHFVEFLLTLAVNVFILFNLTKLMAGDATDSDIGIPVLLSVLAFAVVNIGFRIIFLGFDSIYLVGPEFTAASTYWSESLRFVSWISIFLAYTAQIVVLKVTTKIPWNYLWMPLFVNFIAGNIFLLMVNYWVYFAFYYTGRHL